MSETAQSTTPCGNTRSLATLGDDGVMPIRRAEPRDAALLSELEARLFVQAFGPANDPANVRAHLDETFSADKQARRVGRSKSRRVDRRGSGRYANRIRDGPSRRHGTECPRRTTDRATADLH